MSSLDLVSATVIFRVLWEAVAASVVVSITFALAILGLVRWADLRAENRSGIAAIYGALAACSLVGFLAAVVYGLILLTQKS